MEDVKVFCVNCLNLVDPKTHRNCTLTFDNLVDAEERADSVNFRQNREAVAVEGPEIINLSTCQGRNESNHLMNKHPAFQNPETPIQHQPTEMSSDSDSTSPHVLEAQNPGLQTSRHSDYGNNLSNLSGVNRVLYEPSFPSHNTIHPVYHHFLIGQTIGQVTSNIQQENEFQNSMSQNTERNKFYQEYPQSSYGQNFTKNAIPPPNFPSSFYTPFPTPMQNKGMSTFGQMGYQPYFNYLQHQKQYLPYEPVVNDKVNYLQNQNQYVPYEPAVNNKASPSHDMRVENYSDSIKTSPISPAQTVIPKAYNLSLNEDRELYAENRVPSTNLVSKPELTNENTVEIDAVQNGFLTNNDQSTPYESADSTQKNKKNPHQKTEKTITPKKNVKESTPWKNKEQSVHQKNEMGNSSQGHSDETNLVSETKLTRENVVELDTAQNHLFNNSPQSTPQKKADETQNDKKNSHQKNKISPHQKNKISPHQKTENKIPQENVKGSSPQKNKEQRVHHKNELGNSSLGYSDETNLVSKTELTNENIELDTAQNRLLTNNAQSTPLKSADITQKNKKSPHQKTEKEIIPQENVKGSTPQKNKEQSVHQKNEVGNSSQGHSDETNLLSKTELVRENIVEMDAAQNSFLKNNTLSTPQKSTGRTQKNKKKGNQKNKKSPHQKAGKKIAPQENVNESTPQESKEKSVRQKNEVRNSSQGYSDENVLQKLAEKQVKGKNAEKGVSANNAEKGVHAEDSEENIHTSNQDQGVQGKNPDPSIHATNPEQSVQTKDADQGVNVKDIKSNQGVNAKNVKSEQGVDAKVVKSEQGAHGKDEKNEQKNAGRFTGEGYKSIEEFIEALYNGTLYKRY